MVRRIWLMQKSIQRRFCRAKRTVLKRVWIYSISRSPGLPADLNTPAVCLWCFNGKSDKRRTASCDGGKLQTSDWKYASIKSDRNRNRSRCGVNHTNHEKHSGKRERSAEILRFPGMVTANRLAAGEILPPFLHFRDLQNLN